MDDFDDDNNFDAFEDDEASKALAMERTVMDIDHAAQIRRLVREAAPRAVVSLITLSTTAQNENVRMNASKYLVDLTLDREIEAGGQLEELMGDLVRDASKIANGGAI